MQKSEKLATSFLLMVLGILLICLKDNFIGVLMTLAGACLIVLGIIDAVRTSVPPALIKMLGGAIVIICAWTVVYAAIYIVASTLLFLGVFLLYQNIKYAMRRRTLLCTVCSYASALLCMMIGVLFLCYRAEFVGAIFITCGILTLLEGGLVLLLLYLEESY